MKEVVKLQTAPPQLLTVNRPRWREDASRSLSDRLATVTEGMFRELSNHLLTLRVLRSKLSASILVHGRFNVQQLPSVCITRLSMPFLLTLFWSVVMVATRLLKTYELDIY